MEESTVKMVKEVASQAASSLLSGAVDFLKEQWDAYSKKHLAEIEQIQDAYKTHCLPAEKDHLTLSTLNEKGQVFPIHFEMVPNKDIPILFLEKKFQPKKASSYWKRQLSPSDILNSIEEILGYVCEYQEQRDKRIALKNGYYYDPTNLFFEEFKAWLVKLSHAAIDRDNPGVLPVIQGRIHYLSFLIDHRVFNPGKNRPTREESLLRMRDILKNEIKPTVELAQLKQSAREHFKQLKLNVQRLIKESTEFLFYVFRNSKDTPANFIIAQMKQPTLPSYQSILNDRSGQLLHYLLNTPAVRLACPEGNRAGQRLSTDLTIQEMASSHFVDGHHQLIYPLNTQALPWYQEDGTSQSGILCAFQTDVYMTAFLALHKNIEELSVFYLICGLIFDLAGEGGNLLVYKYALKEVRAVLHRYKALMKEFSINVNILWEASEQLTKDLVESTVESTVETEAWRANKKFSSATYQEIAQLITDNSQLMSTIEVKIIEVNTPEHLEWVKKQTEFLSHLTALFCKTPLMTDSANTKAPKAQIELNPVSKLDQSERKIPKKAISARKATEFYNLAWNAYQSRDYQSAEKLATNLLATYQFDKKFHNDLLVLRYQARVELKHFDAALSDIDEVLNDEPNNIRCRLNKIHLLHYFHCYQDAKREVDYVLKIDGNHQEALRLKKAIDEQLLILIKPQKVPERLQMRF